MLLFTQNSNHSNSNVLYYWGKTRDLLCFLLTHYCMITHGRHGSILNAGHDRYWTFCLPTKLIAKFTFLPAAAANESLRPELQEYAGDQIIILSHSLAQSGTIRNHSLYRNTNSLTKGFESCQCIRDTLVIFFHTAFLNVYAKICRWVMIEFLKF